ncbi:hypothetical protein CPB83DRAFT_891205 [Crepidotus variabilis]|uniref:BHLH domain-containing protein n=1 Tax=Crepidotus variabilis TaxID=179855 RepID=A0A9P6EMK7_9AGAR|nr:hypothetical protein CPB83DRAFT_891205 [Crepidotus variabilis]
MDQHLGDDNNPQNQYNFYTRDHQDPSYSMGYNPGMNAYPGIGHPHNPGNPMVPDMPYHGLAMGLPQAHYQPGPFPGPHGTMPSTTPPPPSPELYDPLSPPLSGSDTSGDGIYHHSNSSGANSPASSRSHSLVHRTPRYNPSPSPTSSSGRRRSRSQDSDDEDMGAAVMDNNNLAHTRKEATRRQRIEAEQRRRDELRDGYAKLKDALPVSNQKSSKVSLLERAVNHIMTLEKENKELQARIAFLDQESQRLRALNEKISLHSEGTASPDASMNRQATPDVNASLPAHSLASIRGQQPPSEHSSPSASEQGH